jgi:hypothetical protein
MDVPLTPTWDKQDKYVFCEYYQGLQRTQERLIKTKEAEPKKVNLPQEDQQGLQRTQERLIKTKEAEP